MGESNSARVREHLANERTYLAWMRTAISLIGLGVVIARLRYLLPAHSGHGYSWKLGLVFSLVGLLTVFLSTWQYFFVLDTIERSVYQPNRSWIIFFSAAVILLSVGVLYVFFGSRAIVAIA